MNDILHLAQKYARILLFTSNIYCKIQPVFQGPSSRKTVTYNRHWVSKQIFKITSPQRETIVFFILKFYVAVFWSCSAWGYNRIPGHLHVLTSHWLRIATIVIFLVLQSTPTHVNGVDEHSEVAPLGAKLQNTQPLISISLNKNSNYCYIPRSSKHTDTCKWSGRVFWSCSQFVSKITHNAMFFFCAYEATSPLTFSYLVHFIAIWFVLQRSCG